MADITRENVIDLVRSLPADRLPSLYDFALYLKARRPVTDSDGDIFGESEEDIRADETWWDEQFARSESKLLRLAEEAAEEYNTGHTTPMEFDEHGRLQQ